MKDLKTPYLDQLIEEHENIKESLSAGSYTHSPRLEKQLKELKKIKEIVQQHNESVSKE